MKKLFIYYSLTGNGELVKEYYENLGYEIRKVEAKRNLPKSFFLKMMVGGLLAGMNHKAKLKDFNYDISSYEEIIIGSPIWNGRLACPINTVLKNLNLDGKKLKFILYSGGGSAPKTIKKINKKYNAEIIELEEPQKYKENLKKLSE